MRGSGARILVFFLMGCGGGRAASDASMGTGMGADTGGPDVVAPSSLDWGTVDVRIADTQPTTTGMTLKVVDEGTPPALDTTLQFPAATMVHQTDGASIIARHTCRNPSLYAIEVSSCANPSRSTRTTTTGCLTVVFDEKGSVIGNFIHPTGVGCDIQSGEANVQMPSPLNAAPRPPDAGAPPPDVAVGTFVVECPGTGGTRLRLEGTFAIPLENSILLCSAP